MYLNNKINMKFEKLKDKLGDWYKPLSLRITDDIFDEMYMAAKQYITQECYPDPNNIFRVFKETSFKDVKVVILGQDPYHDGNATGLAFDCKKLITPSMRNIMNAYNEMYPTHFNTKLLDGNLSYLPEQGVMLLNTALTVEKGKPNSHKLYWEKFTLEVIKVIVLKSKPVVFLLWGAQANKYKPLILHPHKVIYSEHPVAGKYSGRPNWNHNNCFIKANEFLEGHGIQKINW